MEIDKILKAFTSSKEGKFPKSALQAAVAQREKISPLLVDVLSEAGRNIDAMAKKKEDNSFLYAMFLLAQFREPKALQPLLNFFTSNSQTAIALTGDVVTESLGQLLAGVSGGQITPIQEVIENAEIDPFVRGACLEAFLLGGLGRDNSQRRDHLFWRAS